MLFEYENISVSYCTLYTLLSVAGITSPKHQEVKHVENLHLTRPRRECFGELIQIDGSIHPWFDEIKFTLHVAIDETTSTIVGAYFDKEETLKGYYMMFKPILMKYGIPQELYADRRTNFEYRLLKEKDKSVEKDTFTQFQHCCNQLGVEINTTSVSQAKGRVEHLFNTLQNGLIFEMKLNKIWTADEANEFLQFYIPRHNKRFAIQPNYTTSLFAPPPSEEELDYYLSVEYIRKSDKGSVFSIKNRKLKAIDENGCVVAFPAKTKVTFYETLDWRIVCNHNHVFC